MGTTILSYTIIWTFLFWIHTSESSTIVSNFTFNSNSSEAALESDLFRPFQKYWSKAWNFSAFMPNYSQIQDNMDLFLSGFEYGYQRDVIMTHLKFCPFTPMCDFSIGYSRYSCCEDCSCDYQECYKKNTCCPDILFNNTKGSRQTVIKDNINLRQTNNGAPMSCFLLHYSYKKTVQQQSAYGYASCPESTVKELAENCSRSYTATIKSLIDSVPVLSNSSTLYRNRFCAYCHDVFENNFEMLKMKFSCNEILFEQGEKQIIYLIESGVNCDLEYVTVRDIDLCLTTISECNKTGLWAHYDADVANACQLYRSPIRVFDSDTLENLYFSNIFCSFCNGIVPDNPQCEIFRLNSPESYAFSGLLTLPKITSEKSRRKQNHCSDNQIYDGVSSKCVDLFCSPLASFKDGQCFDMFEALKEVIYTIYIRILPEGRLTMADAHILADMVIEKVAMGFIYGVCQTELIYQTNVKYNESNPEDIMKAELMFYDLRIQALAGFLHDPKDIVDRMLELHNTTERLTDNINNISMSLRYLVRDSDSRQFEMATLISEAIGFQDDFASSSWGYRTIPLIYLISNYAFAGEDGLAKILHFRYNEPVCYEEWLPHLNVISLTTCPKIKLSKMELSWVETPYGIVILQGNYSLSSVDYYFLDINHIALCVEIYIDYMETVLSHNGNYFDISPETILSITCSSLSILSLLITLLTYTVFSKLRRTVPGKNNMSLVVTLLSAQCLYLISSLGNEKLKSNSCVIIGILVHFFWLLAIFWMNICTFHAFRVLASAQMASSNSGNRRFYAYHIYSITLSTICVVINIAVSLSTSGNIGYGETVCYISDQKMIVFTFYIPVSFVILSNIIMFIFVIITIKRSSNIQKSVQNERNDIIIFAKLSTITGITWIFGFLYAWTGVIAMSYLFTILSAGQGVFIMLAFVINRRVLDLTRGYFPCFTSTQSDSMSTKQHSVISRTSSKSSYTTSL